MRAHPQRYVFKTRRDIERYFAGKTIECLLCGRRFRRLWMHLVAKHGMSANEYRERFGLPWTRGLTSAASAASSGWTEKRKAKARQLARRTQFFKRAHLAPRRSFAPSQKMEAIRHLGINPRTLTRRLRNACALCLIEGSPIGRSLGCWTWAQARCADVPNTGGAEATGTE